MKLLSVKIVEYADNSQPGWVRCIFNDAQGKQWSIVEKVPIVTTDWLDSDSAYPQLGVVACQIISERIHENNRKVLTIDISIPNAIETEEGQTQFDVVADQVSGEYSQ